jgi:hypothetical protein
MNRIIDLTGQCFGRLTVIEKAPKRPDIKSRHVRWICACVCGNISEVSSAALRCGDTTSCGCLHKELTSAMVKSRNAGKFLALDGTSVGFLTYVKEAPSSHRMRKIVCICACGNEIIADASGYIDGRIKSCGCLRKKLASERMHESHKDPEFKASAISNLRQYGDTRKV